MDEFVLTAVFAKEDVPVGFVELSEKRIAFKVAFDIAQALPTAYHPRSR